MSDIYLNSIIEKIAVILTGLRFKKPQAKMKFVKLPPKERLAVRERRKWRLR
jgi:hypothetical protein